jgi:hypothetical protein
MPYEVQLPSNLVESLKRLYSSIKIFTVFSKIWVSEPLGRNILLLLGCKPMLVYERQTLFSNEVIYYLEFQCGGCRVVLLLPYGRRSKVRKVMKRLNMPLNAIQTVSDIPYVWLDVDYTLDFYLTERREKTFEEAGRKYTYSFRSIVVVEPDIVQMTPRINNISYSLRFNLAGDKLVLIERPVPSSMGIVFLNIVRGWLKENENDFMKSLACATNLLNSIAHQLSIYTLY